MVFSHQADASAFRRPTRRRRSSLVPVVPDTVKLEELCRVPNESRDTVLGYVETASREEVLDCFQFLAAWQATRALQQQSGHDLRVKRRSKPRITPPPHCTDDIVIVRQWFGSEDLTIEVPCWEQKLAAWRSNPLLSYTRVLVENVLYRNYRDRDMLSPTEVMWFLSGASMESMMEQMLLAGTVHPLIEAKREHKDPCWSDAVISHRSGMQAALPWREFFASTPRPPAKTPPPARVSPSPRFVPCRPNSAPNRPTSALSTTSSYALSRCARFP